mgnify:FL=1|tara:strand:- start:5250 stop:5516 length:267 start_codon:yes stop_codon:yes gene_type:complete
MTLKKFIDDFHQVRINKISGGHHHVSSISKLIEIATLPDTPENNLKLIHAAQELRGWIIPQDKTSLKRRGDHGPIHDLKMNLVTLDHK